MKEHPWPLIPAYPCRDLDGTPWPGCDHHEMTEDPAALALLRGVIAGILMAPMPEPFVRAGDLARTTWNCERNKRKKDREVMVDCLTLYLGRGQTMWNTPRISYTGFQPDGPATASRMALRQVTRRDGATWAEEHREENSVIFTFRLEWISPNTGRIEASPHFERAMRRRALGRKPFWKHGPW